MLEREAKPAEALGPAHLVMSQSHGSSPHTHLYTRTNQRPPSVNAHGNPLRPPRSDAHLRGFYVETGQAPYRDPSFLPPKEEKMALEEQPSMRRRLFHKPAQRQPQGPYSPWGSYTAARRRSRTSSAHRRRGACGPVDFARLPGFNERCPFFSPHVSLPTPRHEAPVEFLFGRQLSASSELGVLVRMVRTSRRTSSR